MALPRRDSVPPARRQVDGILLLDKPAGPSSNQVLQRIKRLLHARKAGHAGTLDPLATGLLPLLFGEATKFAPYLSDAYKTYEATILLGVTTTTGDLAGQVLKNSSVTVSSARLAEVIRRFIGTIEQIPPMHSALKRGGRPLYELARRGEVVVRAPRPVRITELAVIREHGNEVDIRVRCSKGTYIRVLAEDIGEALGCGATLKKLRRTAVGGFDIAQGVSGDDFEVLGEAEQAARLLPVDSALLHLPVTWLTPVQVRLVLQGQAVAMADAIPDVESARLYDAQSRCFIGLGRRVDGCIHPVRLLQHRTETA